MDMDLNINNYDFDDILKLFKIKHDYNLDDLKNIKQIVVQTHPDKSGLPKEYFLFYTQAFKLLKNVYQYTNKRESKPDKDIEYVPEDDNDAGKQHLVNKFKNTENFNKWFNKTFEKLNISSDATTYGYGDWFKSNEDVNTDSVQSVRSMHENILAKKEQMFSITPVNDIQGTINNNSCNELDTDRPDEYSTDIFSKLPYEDLKKAHTETVIPIGDSYYNTVQKFDNIGSLQNFRNRQDTTPIDETNSREYFHSLNQSEDLKQIKLAYKLSQQAEQAALANNTMWNSLRKLK